jgi:hypothetical protein
MKPYIIFLNIGSLLGASIGVIVFLLIISLLISAFFIYLGSKMANVNQGTYGNAIKAVLASFFINIIVIGVFSFLPIIGTFIGVIIAFFLVIFAYKSIYNTSFGKGFLIWLFTFVAYFIVGLIAFVLIGGSAATFLK